MVIRELLPNGLRESISKVRSSVAYAVSAIAHWDWPEAWPQLFSLLMGMLVSGDLNAVHGAMRVLTGTGSLSLPWGVTSVALPGAAPSPSSPPVCPAPHPLFSGSPVAEAAARALTLRARLWPGGQAPRFQVVFGLYLEPGSPCV